MFLPNIGEREGLLFVFLFSSATRCWLLDSFFLLLFASFLFFGWLGGLPPTTADAAGFEYRRRISRDTDLLLSLFFFNNCFFFGARFRQPRGGGGRCTPRGWRGIFFLRKKNTTQRNGKKGFPPWPQWAAVASADPENVNRFLLITDVTIKCYAGQLAVPSFT